MSLIIILLTGHSVWFERDVRRIDFVVIFFQWTQNWTALNFEVNFQPLIQLNSRGSQNNSWKGHWVSLFFQGIRKSEDVRDSEKVEVWFYVLSEISFLTRTKPQKIIPWEGYCHLEVPCIRCKFPQTPQFTCNKLGT